MTKIIVVRLKQYMYKLVYTNQGRVMHNRKIVYNIVLVQEAIHFSLTTREEGMIIKLDMENSFDQVRNSFILEVLSKFGFIPTFIH
jgi:hypothetical protein